MNIIYTKIYDFAMIFEDIRSYNHNVIERRIYDLIGSYIKTKEFSINSISDGNKLTIQIVMVNSINRYTLEAFVVLATGIAYQYDLNNERDE